MSLFTTPMRNIAKRQTSQDSSKAAAASSLTGSDHPPDDSEPLQDGAAIGGLSSLKKLGEKTKDRFKGSLLRRSAEDSSDHANRGDHLRRLLLKRKMCEKFRQSLSPRISDQDESGALNRDFPPVPTVMEDDGAELVSTGDDDESASFLPSKYDESLLEEIRNEVETEQNKEIESARIQEMEAIQKEYRRCMKGKNEFPLEVRLKNVTYTVPIDENSSKIQTVYNASCLYPMFKFFKRRIVRGEPMPVPRIVQKHVLQNINLVLKPGVQYLVLGPPGSGKTSLLQAIVGLIKPKAEEEFVGDISYNGRTLDKSDEFHIKNAFAFVSAIDQHAPRLTVEETFEFAFQCSTGGKLIREKVKDADVTQTLKQAEQEHLATRLALSGLGLTEVKDTFVGDTNVRGVSGGQRRRVTVGEMLMSRAPVLCGDEISTGLDAASTYDMIEVLLYYGRSRKQTRIISLLQPSPETVSMFDEVIVLSEGQIIYAGPIEPVEDYFAENGFVSPEFCDVGDFLQMVSSGDGNSLYQPDARLKAIRPDPPTASELAETFRDSKWGKRIIGAVDGPLKYVWTETEMSQHGGEVSGLVMSDAVRHRYANRFPKSTQLITRRFLTLWRRDKRVIIAGAVKNVLMGVSVGGVFYNTDDEISIQGALFQAGLFIMIGSMQSSSGLIQDRIIYYKHADANFYSAWPFIFGRTLSQMPQTFADTITFGTLLYYVIGLGGRTDAVNFFVYMSILLTFAVLMNAQMALYASFADANTVQVFGACTLLAMMLFGGFIITPDDIPKYYSWLYWWNPFAWAQRALVVNEFRQGRWDNPDEILQSNGFVDPDGSAFGQEWVGYSFAYLVPYWLLCCVLSAIGLSSVQHKSNSPSDVGAQSETTSAVERTTTIPFKPVTLSFHDICYTVDASTSQEKLQLLKSVSGIFRSGRLCALMGSSGAGKTTLMDVIAIRKRSGTISGEIRLNGYLQDPTSFRRCSGYVEQFDVQSPELTVRETVLFSARLRLEPSHVDSDEKVQAFVDQILEDVELSVLANALVGSEEDGGLSFEQKKRLSIAVELAASPSILFLDEPTSGLDSRSASLIVRTLRRIADDNRTICATIHQPSSGVFGMFDDLLLLKKGGEVVYHGPLGAECSQLISYFESRGSPRISLGENPANWMLRVITSEEHQDMAAVYLGADEHAKLQAELLGIKNSLDPTQKIEFASEFATPMNRRRQLVNNRLQLIYWRSPTYNLARIMVSIIIAFFLASVFLPDFGKTTYTETEMRAQLSVIFLSFIITGIMAILSVLPVMTKIRDMFYRHRDAGMYDSASMGLALGVAEKYFILLSTTLFCLVFLATANLGNGVRGLIGFWGFFTFNFALYSYAGQLFVCLVKPTATALILCSVFIGIGNFFAGLIVRPQFMVGNFYAFPYYICPGHYVYEGMVMAIYDDNKKTVIAEDGSDFYYSVCMVGEEDCVGTAEEYVNVFFGGEFSKDNIPRDALILGGILVMERVLTWLALKKIRFAD